MAQPVAPISQKEYLQKYLSGKNNKKKRRKKKASIGAEKRSIVVDDDDVKPSENLDEDELDLLLLSEDAPQVAGIIDDRPDELRTMETFRSSERWRVLGEVGGSDDGKGVESATNVLQGDSDENVDEDLSPVRRNKGDSDESPPRSRKKDDSDESPPRSRKKRRSSSSSPIHKQKKLSTEKLSHSKSDKYIKESVPKNRKYNNDGDSSSRNKNKFGREEDISLPKQHRVATPSSRRHNNNSDKLSQSKCDSRRSRSPHRSRGAWKRDLSVDNSPPRKIKIEPESPPRRTEYVTGPEAGRSAMKPGNSSPRQNKHENKYASIKQGKRHVQEWDASAPRDSNNLDKEKARKKQAEDSDESPPRKSRHEDQEKSRRVKHADDSDASPPRKSKQKDVEKSRRKKYIEDFDESPPRKSRRDNEEKSRRKKHSEDSDESPPRKGKRADVEMSKRQKNVDDLEESPPRKSRHADEEKSRRKKHAEDSDESPPRKTKRDDVKNSKRQKNIDDLDESPHRKSRRADEEKSRKKKHDEDSDASPPRKIRQYEKISRTSKHVEDSELPPSRNTKHSSEETSRRKKQTADSDESPPRKNKRADEKVSSRAKPEADLEESQARRHPNEPVRERHGMKAAAILGVRQSGSKIQKGASEGYMTPIYRDRKTGKIRDLEEEARQKAEDSKKTDVEKEKYTRWGKGLAQVAATEARVLDALHEVTKPVARYADDVDLDRMLRAQEREGDPMLEYMRSKSTNVSVASKPKYQGSWMPNRYNIPPGHRWDGVDRSSGYEKRWFDTVNARRATEEDAYKWSVADM